MRLVVVDGDQRIKTVAHRCRQALGQALRQQRAGLVAGSPYRATQHRVGRGENMLVAEPSARPRQQRGGALDPQRFVFQEPRQSVGGVGGLESTQSQVLADALLMFGDRLLPAGVSVDRLGVGSQLDSAVIERILRHPGLPIDIPEARPARPPPMPFLLDGLATAGGDDQILVDTRS